MADTIEDSPKEISTDETDESILEIARKRFNLAVEAESQIRKDALDDLKFRAGDQWDSEIRKDREADRRPCLTINRLPQYIKQVTNDQRQNRPSIKVNPVDDDADVDTATIMQGLIRHIEYSSNADVAYDTSFEGAATKGLGYFRIITEFCDPMSFDQEIRIKRIRNSFSVYLDPTYQEPDGSDANWGFVFEDMSEDDYRAQFPKSKLSGMTDWQSIGDTAPGWATGNTCRVAEYFYKTFEQVEIALMIVNGKKVVVPLNEVPEVLPPGVELVAKRTTVLPKIKWVKMNAVEILEKTDWLGKWIPIIPVLGDELDIDGERILEGVIRHAKDPQRMYNVWASAETETIGLAPKAPYIGVEGQFEGYEGSWATANTKSHAYLQVKPISIAGVPVGLPQRQTFEPNVMAISQARMQSAEEMKATTGIYDSTLGMKSNESSGVAIARRANQAQTNNYHFIDNLTRALRHAGCILLDLIPHIYDTERTVRILGEDGKVEMVKINQIFEKNGEQKEYRLDVGKYDVAITTGPSFATKRQEARETMLEFAKIYPQAAQVIGDLIALNMDWPGAQQIAERLKKLLPPGIAEPEEGEQKPIPPEVKAQMDQMSQMVEALTQQLDEKTKAIENKTIELESKERIEMQKIQANIEIEMAKMGSKEAMALLQHEVAEIQQRMSLLNYEQPIENENGAGALGDGVDEQQSIGGLPPSQPVGELP